MKALQSKMVHMAAVAGLVGYCYWCEQDATKAPAANTTRHSSLKELLSPAIEPAQDRDPFRELAPQIAAGETDAAKAGKKEAEREAAELKGATNELALAGTFIHGKRRLALINGNFYSEGESLQPMRGAGQYVVAEITSDKVLLDRLGQTLVLQYSTTSVKAASPSSEPPGSPPHRGAK